MAEKLSAKRLYLVYIARYTNKMTLINIFKYDSEDFR